MKKHTRKKTYALSLSQDIHAHAKSEAAKQRISVSLYIEQLIIKDLKILGLVNEIEPVPSSYPDPGAPTQLY